MTCQHKFIYEFGKIEPIGIVYNCVECGASAQFNVKRYEPSSLGLTYKKKAVFVLKHEHRIKEELNFDRILQQLSGGGV